MSNFSGRPLKVLGDLKLVPSSLPLFVLEIEVSKPLEIVTARLYFE